jgi:superfamily II DNA or RNA helicase
MFKNRKSSLNLLKRLYSTVLRPYQSECIETCLNELEQGCKRQAVSLPVGKFFLMINTGSMTE